MIVMPGLTAPAPHGARAEPMAERGDYFISGDTVLIGGTAGAAAGILAGSLPVLAALISGVGLAPGITTLVHLTGPGCGVGAASGGVAILTYVAGAALLSCGMAIASGAGGMGTARLLELWRRPEPATVPQLMPLPPATKG